MNAYLDGLKNISPRDLHTALTEREISSETKLAIYGALYEGQRLDGVEDVTASQLPHIPNEDINDGRWIETIGVQGRLTDAQMDSVGIAETKRVVMVVDGRMYAIEPDTQVAVYKMPAEPEA